ncbi:MAG: folate-binding protein YgfZ [Burkholderiales bacterium]|nr:folate-binding protein YgfZ [Burkholderiales bacterium]
MSSAMAAGAPTAASGALLLDDWGLIRAQGDDAASFLHGQLTQDFAHLAADRARLAGYCSAKGRLLASFVGWQAAPGEWLLACSGDLLAPTLKRLSMFVLRARCKLGDASAERPLWGLAGAAAQQALGAAAPDVAWGRATYAGADVIRLPDARLGELPVPRWLLAGTPPPGLPPLAASTWQGLEASSGVARIVAATAEQFVPQMINLELVGGVAFDKGCYPGQEVVARSQYRGTIKRRAALFFAAAPLAPGQEIFHSGDAAQPAGRVVNAGVLPGLGPVVLAEVKLAALGAGTLHAGTAQGPLLRPGALPYALPAEAP